MIDDLFVGRLEPEQIVALLATLPILPPPFQWHYTQRVGGWGLDVCIRNISVGHLAPEPSKQWWHCGLNPGDPLLDNLDVAAAAMLGYLGVPSIPISALRLTKDEWTETKGQLERARIVLGNMKAYKYSAKNPRFRQCEAFVSGMDKLVRNTLALHDAHHATHPQPATPTTKESE